MTLVSPKSLTVDCCSFSPTTIVFLACSILTKYLWRQVPNQRDNRIFNNPPSCKIFIFFFNAVLFKASFLKDRLRRLNFIKWPGSSWTLRFITFLVHSHTIDKYVWAGLYILSLVTLVETTKAFKLWERLNYTITHFEVISDLHLPRYFYILFT